MRGRAVKHLDPVKKRWTLGKEVASYELERFGNY